MIFSNRSYRRSYNTHSSRIPPQVGLLFSRAGEVGRFGLWVIAVVIWFVICGFVFSTGGKDPDGREEVAPCSCSHVSHITRSRIHHM
ncbi:MAG: hypothetical protein WCF23_07670 [Candidatus Nitrosopolaris sp.]